MKKTLTIFMLSCLLFLHIEPLHIVGKLKTATAATKQINDTTDTNRTASSQWNIQQMNIQQAWSEGLTGKNVKIAVIDTGMNTFSNRLVPIKSISFAEDNPFTRNINEADTIDRGNFNEGHGTPVTSIIATKAMKTMAGIAPDAQIYNIKYTDGTMEGYLENLIRGIEWAITQNVDIINISSGTYEYSKAFEKVIKKAVQKRIIVVAATGNDGSTNLFYPAAFKQVLSVTALDERSNISSFANYNKAVTFAAPGDDVKTLNTKGVVQISSGTSFAAPHITALIALYKQRTPYLSQAQIKQLLLKNSHTITHINGKTYMPYYQTKSLKKPPAIKKLYVKATDHTATMTLETAKNNGTPITRYIVIQNGKQIAYSKTNKIVLQHLKANQTYTYKLTTMAASGKTTTQKTVSFKTKQDVTPPKAVKNLQVTYKNDKATLQWKNPTDFDLKHVTLYKNGKRLKHTTAQSYSFTCKKGVKYTFVIEAMDTSNNTSTKKAIIVKR